MSGFQGYDQWKTASPYDDEPDPVEEGKRLITLLETKDVLEWTPQELDWAIAVFKEVVECLEHEV